MKRLMILPLAALAACNAEPAGQTASASNSAGGNIAAADAVDYPARIRTMAAGQRNAVFLRAVRDAGRACQGVTDATEVTVQGGPATWSAACEDGVRWIVAISPTGTATVTNQAELQGARKG